MAGYLQTQGFARIEFVLLPLGLIAGRYFVFYGCLQIADYRFETEVRKRSIVYKTFTSMGKSGSTVPVEFIEQSAKLRWALSYCFAYDILY